MNSVRGLTRTRRSSGAASVPVVSAMPARSSWSSAFDACFRVDDRERERLEVGGRARERVSVDDSSG